MSAWPLSRRTLGTLAVWSLLLVAADDPPAPVEETEATFVSHRKKVAVERFEPNTPGPHPAILVLHGVNGIDDHPRTMLRERARELARAGYVALIPHYFERTGANLKNANRNRQYFQVWMETIRDAVTYAAAQPAVDRRRIGLLGYSLGAHVAVSESAFDSRIGAVVEYAGGLLPDLVDRFERTPPILILHGDADRSVPVAEARKLAALLESRQLPYEISIYKGAGHSLSGDDRTDAWQKTLAFFQAHLDAR